MMWHSGAGMGWWMVFGGLLWLLFVGALVYLFVWLFRTGSRSERDVFNGGDALEVARRRYAAGEITREQFEQIRGDLETPGRRAA